MLRLILIVVLVVVLLAILMRRKRPPPPMLDEIRPIEADEARPALRPGEDRQGVADLPSEAGDTAPRDRTDS